VAPFAVPTRVGRPGAGRELDVRAAFLLLHADGREDLASIGDLTALPFEEVRRVFAALLATTHLWGLTTAPYADRYALPLLCTTPVLLLAFVAWPIRGAHGPRVALVFLPLAAAVAWVLGPSPGALGQERLTATMEPWAMARPACTLVSSWVAMASSARPSGFSGLRRVAS